MGFGYYRRVYVRMWGDEKFRRLSRPQPNGQSLWQYLMTGPHTGPIPGLFEAGEAGLAEALGWPLKAFREAFREAFLEGMVKADWKARVVWLPNAPSYNPPASPNVVKSWADHFVLIPECGLKTEAGQTLKAFAEGLGKAFGEAFHEAFGEVARARDQEQEQDLKTSSPTPSSVDLGKVDEPSLLLACWNTHADRSRADGRKGLHRADELTAERRKRAAARLKEAELAWHDEAISRLARSPFACGAGPPKREGDKPWRASFDWYIANETNPVKAHEGRYDA